MSPERSGQNGPVTAPQKLAVRWRMARRVYPTYVAIASAFQLGTPPFTSLEDLKQGSEPEVLNTVERWVDELDAQIKAFHLRQILQNADPSAVEPTLGSLGERYMKKNPRSEAERDKLDFILSQYVAVCAPPSFHRRKLELEDVGEILESIIGRYDDDDLTLPAQLEELVAATPEMTSMRALVESKIIERGRELKVAAGERYFQPGALVAFTRFNYVVRRTYLRLMDAELSVVASNLQTLSEMGVETLDCRAAHLQVEPVSRLKELIAGWKRPQITDYSNDQQSIRVMELRSITDAALATTDPRTQVRELQKQVAELLVQFRQVSGELEALRREKAAGVSAAVAVPAASAVPSPAPPSSAPAPPAPPAAPAAPPKPADVPPAALSPEAAETLISQFVERIGNDLSPKGAKKLAGRSKSIAIGNQALLLTEAEIGAFENPANDALNLRRCVAVRAILITSVESRGKEGTSIRNAATLGQAEMARAEAAEAKATGDAKGAIATSRARLAAVVRHAATLAR